ncbi:MAG: primase-helicase family protein [Candidatus Babeliales bacterium]
MNNNKNTRFDQQRMTPCDSDLAAARAAWSEQEKTLIQKKEALGFGSDVSVEKILLNTPSAELDQATISQILALQSSFKELAEQKKILWPEDAVVDELNQKHAIVRIDQTYILTEKDNDLFGGKDFTLESRQSFRLYYEDEVVLCSDGKQRSKADIWLKSPRRRKYDGITFDPKIVGPVNERYNIWKGFAIEPVAGDCSLFWAHVRDTICSGNEVTYKFLRKWMAYVFQHPDVVHTALVICGSQGVGKNKFIDPLGFLLGQHYVKLSSLAELLSHFNAHLKNGVLINANEALWGGNKKETGALKAMITEPICLIESKGRDSIQLRNYKHVVVTSNEDWPVDIDPDDRRFFVLKVSENHKEDTTYFADMQNQLENGGYAALLYDLLNEDVSDFNPRKLPVSTDSFAIKLRSADSTDRYLYFVLHEGIFYTGERLPSQEAGWSDIYTDMFYDLYAQWCDESNEKKITKNIFCQKVKERIPSITTYRPSGSGKRPRKYRVPDIEDARKEFSKAYRVGEEIWDDGDSCPDSE